MINSYENLITNNDFKELKQYLVKKMSNSSNIFDLLNASNYEIRHSRYLAWLFKNSNLLKLLLNIDIPENLKVHTEYPVPEDGIYKKKGRIDILIESNNFVCVIENKYGSKEHSKQCQRYRKFIEKFFENSVKKYIFLDIYKPNKELFEKGKELEGYESITYRDLLGTFKDEKFKLNEDNDFNEKVLEQYKEIIKSNYDINLNDCEKKLYKNVFEQSGAIKVLLKPYKYDASKPDDCMTIYKLQTYMWAHCLKNGNELIKDIKNSKNLECFSEYIGNNYGSYRCYPKGCDVECLNFGVTYNPIMFIAIINNLSIKEGKKYGINISIELDVCNNNQEERKRIFEAANGKKRYSSGWKILQQEEIISRESYFASIIKDENNQSIVSDKDVNEKIDDTITKYKKILKNYSQV